MNSNLFFWQKAGFAVAFQLELSAHSIDVLANINKWAAIPRPQHVPIGRRAECHLVSGHEVGECCDFLPMRLDLRHPDRPTIRPSVRFCVKVEKHRLEALPQLLVDCRAQAKGMLDQLTGVEVLEAVCAVLQSISHSCITGHSVAPHWPPVGVRKGGHGLRPERLVTLQLDAEQHTDRRHQDVQAWVAPTVPREADHSLKPYGIRRPSPFKTHAEGGHVGRSVEEQAESVRD